ncbi:MAG: hypothetical protein IPL74_19460 [Bacteroidetes bacterium]|nr:hypothetical protein [Bacteroidota bacterium]
MRSKYQVASCKVSVFSINDDYDIGAFNQDVLQYFNGKVDKNNIIVKQIGSGFGNNLLVVAKQIFNQYQPI